ncbi:MAG: hypothetical protein SGI77_27165 [Pirellulaceae bacterium]|nr:hypothetical protein [Pirellulaceae bacterium]
MTEYDSPWKEAIDEFFESFMAICFPPIHARIDWQTDPKMLDKELQQIAPESEIGVRVVDKLVEVQLISGTKEWILVHIEILTQAKKSLLSDYSSVSIASATSIISES